MNPKKIYKEHIVSFTSFPLPNVKEQTQYEFWEKFNPERTVKKTSHYYKRVKGKTKPYIWKIIVAKDREDNPKWDSFRTTEVFMSYNDALQEINSR